MQNWKQNAASTLSVLWFLAGLIILQRIAVQNGLLLIHASPAGTTGRHTWPAFALSYYKGPGPARHDRQRLQSRSLKAAREEPETTNSSPLRIPKPSTNNPDDDFFRSFRQRVPKSFQSWMRDSGVVRGIMDSLVWTAIPSLLYQYPWAVFDFFRLTTPSSGQPAGRMAKRVLHSLWNIERVSSVGLRHDLEFDVERHFYGPDKRQFVSLISSTGSSQKISAHAPLKKHRTIVVVHGGAWGSGFPSMYALTATPFLNEGYTNVALVGYRTFPSADLNGQLDDIAQALECISQLTRHENMTVVGHSSGSHLLTMAFMEGRLALPNLDQYVGMAGVYDIPSHYRFERGRGIQRISPMAAACGYTLNNWKQSSPLYILRTADNKQQKQMLGRFPTSTMLLHGNMDTTVPYAGTKHFAEVSGLDWHLLEDVGHADMVLEIMFGGGTLDFILNWTQEKSHANE